MLTVISPAKRLDWAERTTAMTTPDFLAEANSLARTMRARTLTELRGLMDLSDDLARLNRDRFRAYEDAPADDLLRPAALAFAGDTYMGLEAGSLDADDMAFAQDHLRILSGLYGVLRPLDGIQPYRLEMGSRLKTRRGNNLYDYWGDAPAKALKRQADAIGTDTLVNCASQEYFGAVNTKKLGLRVITPVFLEERNGTAKTISFFAKKARGAMARFLTTHRVTTPDGIPDFDLGGYAYDRDASTPDAPVFSRPAE
jgi:cytoplasmic iron level regulating protein YaaA (DUF328/UPF0246 family)